LEEFGALMMKIKMISGIRIGVFIATLLFAHLGLSPLAWSQPFQIQARALSGTDGALGPGLGQGVFFNAFSNYSVNENGQVSIFSTLTGTGVSAANDRGIWMGHEGGLVNVARRGDQVSGAAPDTVFDKFEFMSPFSNSQGGLFTATLAGTGTDSSNNQGLWGIDPTTFSISGIGRAGDSVPGFGSDFRYTYFYPNIARNLNGQTAFSVNISGPGVDVTNSNLMMRIDQGQVSLVAQRGNAAPGVSGTFWNLTNRLTVNQSGQIAFNASIISGTNQNDGVWVVPTTQPELRATSFQSAPGTNGSFFNFGPPVTNDSGAVAFWATLSSGTEDNGIWSDASGDLSLVARTGQQAAGTGFGVQFKDFSFGERMMIDGMGQTYFEATLQGAGVSTANDRGFWQESHGSLSLLAREGDLAPDLDSTANFSTLSSLVVNSSGQIAFIGGLTGSGIDTTNNRGLWASDLEGDLHLLVRRGEQFNISGDLNDADWRTISNVSIYPPLYSGGEDGIRNHFNNQGQLAFRLSFTDGTSGIFVANTWAAVPEPASCLVLMALATGFAIRRRSRQI